MAQRCFAGACAQLFIWAACALFQALPATSGATDATQPPAWTGSSATAANPAPRARWCGSAVASPGEMRRTAVDLAGARMKEASRPRRSSAHPLLELKVVVYVVTGGDAKAAPDVAAIRQNINVLNQACASLHFFFCCTPRRRIRTLPASPPLRVPAACPVRNHAAACALSPASPPPPPSAASVSRPR